MFHHINENKILTFCGQYNTVKLMTVCEYDGFRNFETEKHPKVSQVNKLGTRIPLQDIKVFKNKPFSILLDLAYA